VLSILNSCIHHPHKNFVRLESVTATKRILKYLKGTANLALKCYRKTNDGMLIGYSAVDWAGDQDDWHSTILWHGNLFLLHAWLGDQSVGWVRSKQSLHCQHLKQSIHSTQHSNSRSSLAQKSTHWPQSNFKWTNTVDGGQSGCHHNSLLHNAYHDQHTLPLSCL